MIVNDKGNAIATRYVETDGSFLINVSSIQLVTDQKIKMVAKEAQMVA